MRKLGTRVRNVTVEQDTSLLPEAIRDKLQYHMNGEEVTEDMIVTLYVSEKYKISIQWDLSSYTRKKNPDYTEDVHLVYQAVPRYLGQLNRKGYFESARTVYIDGLTGKTMRMQHDYKVKDATGEVTTVRYEEILGVIRKYVYKSPLVREVYTADTKTGNIYDLHKMKSYTKITWKFQGVEEIQTRWVMINNGRR